MNAGRHNKRHEIVKIFALIVLCIFCTVIALSAILYIYAENILTETINSSLQNQLYQASYSTNFMSEYTITMALQLYFDPNLSKMLFSSFSDWREYVAAQSRLDFFRVSTPFIHSIYLYNVVSDEYYISSPYSEAKIQSKESFFDKEINSALNNYNKYKDNILNAGNALLLVRSLPYSSDESNNGTAKNVYTMIYKNAVGNSSNPNSAVILNISTEWIQQTIATMGIDSGINVFAINKKGAVVIRNSYLNILTDLSSASYIRKILSSSQTSGYFITSVGDEKYLSVYQKTCFLDWIFVCMIPYRQVIGKIQQMRNYTVCISGILLACGFMISILISRYLYRPINKIYDRANWLEDYRGRVFNTLKQNYLRTLIQFANEQNLSKIDMEFKDYEFKINPYQPYTLIILKIGGYGDLIKCRNNQEHSELKLQILDIVSETISQKYKNEQLSLSGQYMALILNIEDTSLTQFKSIIGSILNDIQKKTKNQLDVMLSAFVSSPENSFANIHKLYQKLMELTNYTLVYGQQCIIFESDVDSRDETQKYKYPAHKEKLLLDSIMLGRDSGAVKSIYLEIINDAKRYSCSTLKMCILSLAFAVNKAISAFKNSNEEYEISLRFKCFVDNLEKYETIDEINQEMQSLLDSILEQHNKLKNNKYDELFRKAKQLIERQYGNKELCLNSIAEEIKMSPPYFARLFKHLTSKSIPDYLNEIRLNKARELLLTTDWPVGRIAEAVGFSSDTYFFKVFKKSNGITPIEFRKNN